MRLETGSTAACSTEQTSGKRETCSVIADTEGGCSAGTVLSAGSPSQNERLSRPDHAASAGLETGEVVTVSKCVKQEVREPRTGITHGALERSAKDSWARCCCWDFHEIDKVELRL